MRRLALHSSTASVKGIVKIVEERQPQKRGAAGRTGALQGGADCIALSADGQRLYHAPLMGRHLYEIPTAALLDPRADEASVVATALDSARRPDRADSSRTTVIASTSRCRS